MTEEALNYILCNSRDIIHNNKGMFTALCCDIPYQGRYSSSVKKPTL